MILTLQELITKYPPFDTATQNNMLLQYFDDPNVSLSSCGEPTYILDDALPDLPYGFSSSALAPIITSFLPEDFEESIVALYFKNKSSFHLNLYLALLTKRSFYLQDLLYTSPKVFPHIKSWNSRKLHNKYATVFLETYNLQTNVSLSTYKVVTVAIGIMLNGHKEALSIYINDDEKVSYYDILTDLKSRGVHDILIITAEDLSELSNATKLIFPNTEPIYHISNLIQYSTSFVHTKDMALFKKELKKIYSAPTEGEARLSYLDFQSTWSGKYSSSITAWADDMPIIAEFTKYPPMIRQILYSTTDLEQLKKEIYRNPLLTNCCNDIELLRNVYFLIRHTTSNTWCRASSYWKSSLDQLCTYFSGRISRFDIIEC